MKSVLAIDLGASSGRAIKASYDGDKINYEEIHRFDNIPLEIDGHLHHDIEMMLNEIKTAISKAGKIDSVAFDTWGVDYGLLDGDGILITPPFHYRDSRTEKAVDRVKEKIPLSDLYSQTGNQIMNINTLFQLISDDNLPKAKKLLFMPDLFAYLLCGNEVCEKTIASTSQMLSPLSACWCDNILDTFGIEKSLFPDITNTSSIIGEYNGIKVITVAGHDTQCAIAAMPSDSKNEAFLSCGTWSLIGCELDSPVLNDKSMELELSNELGANGKINYLKNISGLWLVQETRRALKNQGQRFSYNEMEMLARECTPFKCFIDPDDPLLAAHGNLPQKICSYCMKTEQNMPFTVGETVRCIYESLALKYRCALEQIKECTGKSFDTLHILGGGTKDSFLCEMTADSIDMPVCAGPVEATALGNIIMQLIALGEIKDIDSGRKIISNTEKLITYEPKHTSAWENAYKRYKKILAYNKEI